MNHLFGRESAIFVAGGETLIGAAILRRLQIEGYVNLHGYPSSQPDLSDRSAVEAFFAETRPEFVFHAGGRSGGIAANSKRPADLMHDNLLVTAHVVDSAFRHGARKLLFLASSCCYPRLCSQPMRESELWTGPLEPTSAAYATAKLAGIALCQAYRRQHGADFIVGIPANAFGLGDDFSPEGSHVIGGLLRRFHEAKIRGEAIVTVWGSGNARREFIFADDLADSIIFTMQNYSDAEPINLGGGCDVSINELAERIRRVVGFSGQICFDSSQPEGAPLKALDSSKLAALGWRGSGNVDEALTATYGSFLESWHRLAPVA